jgi:hypothetical protein
VRYQEIPHSPPGLPAPFPGDVVMRPVVRPNHQPQTFLRQVTSHILRALTAQLGFWVATLPFGAPHATSPRIRELRFDFDKVVALPIQIDDLLTWSRHPTSAPRGQRYYE